MKMYSFVVLKTGPVEVTDEDSVSFYMTGHLVNISRLVEEGKLSVAGPFGPNDLDYRSFFIRNAQSTEEAQELLGVDLAIARGNFKTEIIPVYSSSALPTYLEN
ncbi:MAG: hypothetical protein MK086_05385 [Flavobacteriales bacterium]|nr:hypothetical protein [Flavobacteriales bacterium]